MDIWRRLDDLAGQPYVWSDTGPPIEVERVGAVIPTDEALLADAIDPWALLRRAADRARFLTTLPAGIQAVVRWADAVIEAHRQAELERERIQRTCPWCGCDPDEHAQRD